MVYQGMHLSADQRGGRFVAEEPGAGCVAEDADPTQIDAVFHGFAGANEIESLSVVCMSAAASVGCVRSHLVEGTQSSKSASCGFSPSPETVAPSVPELEVIYIDRFGNAITNVARAQLPGCPVTVRREDEVIGVCATGYMQLSRDNR
jgi:hypothetical protein